MYKLTKPQNLNLQHPKEITIRKLNAYMSFSFSLRKEVYNSLIFSIVKNEQISLNSTDIESVRSREPSWHPTLK